MLLLSWRAICWTISWSGYFDPPNIPLNDFQHGQSQFQCCECICLATQMCWKQKHPPNGLGLSWYSLLLCCQQTMIIIAKPKRDTGTVASTYNDPSTSSRSLLLPCNNSIISVLSVNKPSLVSLPVCSYFGRT